MSGDREAMSEQSSLVREGASSYKLYPSGHESEEYLTSSLEREPSTHSPAEEEKEYEEDEGEAMGDEDKEGEEEGESEGNDEGDEEWLTRKGNVKRLVTVLGPSSFLLYGR